MNGRVEIITGPERRQPLDQRRKMQLVAEACQPGNSVSQASQLFGCRKAMAKGLITDRRLGERTAKVLVVAPR